MGRQKHQDKLQENRSTTDKPQSRNGSKSEEMKTGGKQQVEDRQRGLAVLPNLRESGAVPWRGTFRSVRDPDLLISSKGLLATVHTLGEQMVSALGTGRVHSVGLAYCRKPVRESNGDALRTCLLRSGQVL